MSEETSRKVDGLSPLPGYWLVPISEARVGDLAVWPDGLRAITHGWGNGLIIVELRQVPFDAPQEAARPRADRECRASMVYSRERLAEFGVVCAWSPTPPAPRLDDS